MALPDNPNFATFPPPDLGFMITKGRLVAPAAYLTWAGRRPGRAQRCASRATLAAASTTLKHDLPQLPGHGIHHDHHDRRREREREPAQHAAVDQEPPGRRADDDERGQANQQRGKSPQGTSQHHHHRGGRSRGSAGRLSAAARFAASFSSARPNPRDAAPRN